MKEPYLAIVGIVVSYQSVKLRRLSIKGSSYKAISGEGRLGEADKRFNYTHESSTGLIHAGRGGAGAGGGGALTRVTSCSCIICDPSDSVAIVHRVGTSVRISS